MKKLKNVLYVMSENSQLYVKNKSLAVKVDEKEITIPVHTIESVVCFGNMSFTTPFISFCCENEVTVNFMSQNGRFYGRVVPPVHGNIMLRKNHFKILEDNKKSLSIAKKIIKTKIINSENTLSRFDNRKKDIFLKIKVESIRKEFDSLKQKVEKSKTADELRGYEGLAANMYFNLFDDLIKNGEMKFEKRTKRPPENNFNSLLSFIYTLVTNDMESALESVGLDVQGGFFHTLRSGRPALALDMIEEFRSPLCDRLAIGLINNSQIKEDEFTKTEEGIFLSPEARKVVVDAWQQRKKEEIFHPYFNEKIQIGLLPYAQAQIMAKYIRGDEEEYKPFLWK